MFVTVSYFQTSLTFACKAKSLLLETSKDLHLCRLRDFLSLFGWVGSIDIESQNRLLKVCYAPATSTGLPRWLLLLFSFFAAAINSTNEANKAGSMRH